MKRFAVLLLALAMTVCCALPAFAAGTIEVTEDVSVSDDYDWTRFKGQNVAINVYNWGEYISNGSDDSVDVVSAFEQLTGIKVNYTTFDSNESMYAKLKSGAANYDVVIPSTIISRTSKRSIRNMWIRITIRRMPTPCPTCSVPPASFITPPWWTKHPPAGLICGTSSTQAIS